jgi:hypothetical protein
MTSIRLLKSLQRGQRMWPYAIGVQALGLDVRRNRMTKIIDPE